MKRTYAVYVILRLIQNDEKVDKEIMVFNVQAESNGGAEHVLLDTIPLCDNALAFSEKEMVGEYFNTLLSRSKVYDLRDFRQRCVSVITSRMDQLQTLYDETEQARQECARLEKEMADLQGRLRSAREWFAAAYEAYKEAQQLYGMSYSPEDESLQGTA